MNYDLLIIGGGPAGVAGGVYAARKKMKTVLVAKEIGGQSFVSDDIHNWIGVKDITGFDLAKRFEEHLADYKEDIEVVKGEEIVRLEKAGEGFRATSDSGKTYEAHYVLLTAGSRRRKLGVPGEKEHEGKGVVYCSTCDAPLFKGMTVAVVGGGNAGLEAVVDLFPYAEKIYLVVRSEGPKGDPITLEKVKASEKVTVVPMAETTEITGEKSVSGLKYKDKTSGEVKELAVGGVFVEIGAVPNSEFVKNLVELNDRGEVVVDHKTQRTSLSGIWAAGDITDVLFKQNNISAGDAVKAVLDIYEHARKR